jgi:hypothetical protein
MNQFVLQLNNSTMHFIIRTRSTTNKFSDKKLTNSTLNLDTTGLFHDGRIRVRCFAEIEPVYKASASIEITQEHPYLASIKGDASSRSRSEYLLSIYHLAILQSNNYS